jgi:hypothetical protein
LETTPVASPPPWRSGAFQDPETHHARRVADGEFDASLEESEEWARNQTDPKVIAIMQAMGIGPDRSHGQ